ncbi:MAG: FtsQ-type POTRA domain-containing protein [Actinobacteria bacterium]|nr:FtsQ-type POTRA domain-containing protein [Actinomycetota bacterium]
MASLKRANIIKIYLFLNSILFATLFLAAAYILARSSLFEVREIEVLGNASLNRDQIVSISGLNPGENIFRINLQAAAEKLRVIPMIKNVDMTRRLPSTVQIKVEERKPVALLPVEAGFIQIDDEGVYIQKGDIGQDQLPVVTGVQFPAPVPGGRIVSENLDSALAVVRGVPAQLLPQLSEINTEGGQAVIYTLDGIRCRLGVAQDLEQKGEVLMKVLDGLKEKGKKIEYIDLTYAGSPVVKYTE